jgi:hypothetical protein
MAAREVKAGRFLEKAHRTVIDELSTTQGGKGNWVEEREQALERFNNMPLEELVDYIKKHSRGPNEGQEVL